MEVLIDHGLPFAFAHGGHRTQIEQTRRGLERSGVQVDWLRWWDETQRGNLIHVFAPTELSYLRTAIGQGRRVVLTTLLTGECNHSPRQLAAKRAKLALLKHLPGFGGVNSQMAWQAFHEVALNIVGLEAEARVLREVYRVPARKIAVVPLGLSDAYRNLPPPPDRTGGRWLICTGTITERKRTIDLARLARRAGVPVLFVGKGYRPDDPYFLQFRALVDGRFVHHQDHVEGVSAMITLYREARGFVIFSDIENWCLSAHEAAACGLPVLLRPLPWAKERFDQEATYFTGDEARDAEVLRRFYEEAAVMPPPSIRQWSWLEVGSLLEQAYQSALAGV